MEKKSIKKNYIYNVSYHILQMIMPLVITPYISRVLGADGVGTVSFAESVVSYFTLFAVMGIAIHGQREISYVQFDLEKRSEIFWNIKLLECTTSLVALCGYFIFAMRQENRIIYLLLSFNILAKFVDVTWFFQGMEEFGKIVIRNIFFKLANIIYMFLVVRDKEDVLLYIFGLSFFTFLGNVSLWGYLKKYIVKFEREKLHPYKSLPMVLSLFIPTIAIQIYTVFDKTMIGVITRDSFENGYYEQAIKISKTVLTIVTSLGTVMIPRIGFHFQNKETDKIKQLMYRGYRFVWFLGIPLCFGLMTVAKNFVPWFFGDGFDQVIILIQILSLLILAIGISNVTGMQYLIPTKRQNIFTLTVIIGAIINFTLNITLIRMFQALGAAIASVAAETMIAAVQLFFVRKELSAWKILKDSLHYLAAGIVMALFLWRMGRNMSASVFHTFVLVVSGAIIYFAILLLMQDDFFISQAKLVLRKIRNSGNIYDGKRK